MSERDILKSCKHRLDYWQSIGIVVHYDRFNSGKIQYNGKWIQMCKSGTPDLIAYIKTNKETCLIYFIECKRDDKQKLRTVQQNFKDKFIGLNNVMYEMVSHPRQIDITLESITGYGQGLLDNIKL